MVVVSKIGKSEFVRRYVLLWNGYFNLSPKQIEILVYIIEQGGMSREVITSIKSKYDLTHQAWYHFKNKLIDRGALTLDGEVNPRLIPRKEITFRFNIDAVG